MLIVLLVALISFGLFQGGYADCTDSSATIVSGTYAPQGQICPGDLIFEETFDTFDLKIWQHEINLAGGGNGEFQWYTNNRNNSYTRDGNLHINPTLVADDTGEDFLYSGTLDLNDGSGDACTDNPQSTGCIRTGTADSIINPIKSARIKTVESFSFRYGVVEVRAKLPAGDWLWPAIWMMPRYSVYSGWPTSGEIDIMESRGNRELYNSAGLNFGTQQVGETMHWGPNPNYNRYPYTHYEKNNGAGYNTDFHIYKLEWNERSISFLVDDEVVGTVTPPDGGFWELGELEGTGLQNPWNTTSTTNFRMAPFDQEFYIIINLAIGGVNYYFPDNASNPGGKPWKNSSPRAMTDFWEGREQWLPTWDLGTDDPHLQVDYVRVWAI